MYTIKICTVAPDRYVNEIPEMTLSGVDLEILTELTEIALDKYFTFSLAPHDMLNLVETGSLTHFAGLELLFEVTK